MKSKYDTISNTMISFLVFALIAVIYFLWQPYDKCLIQPSLISINTLADYATRIIYYLILYFCVLAIIKTLFNTDRLFGFKNCMKPFLAIFALRIACDIGVIVIRRIIFDSDLLVYIVFLFIESLFDIGLITIPVFMLSKKNKTKKGKLLFFCFFSIVVIGILIIIYRNAILIYHNNPDFWEYELYIANICRDTVVPFLSLLVLLSCFEQKEYNENSFFKVFSKLLIRIIAVVGIFAIIAFVKLIAIPHSYVKGIDFANGRIVEIQRYNSYSELFNTDDNAY